MNDEEPEDGYRELALTNMRLVEQKALFHANTKTVLERLLYLKKALRTYQVYRGLYKDPRAICEETGAAQYGWHFIKAEGILNAALQQRFLGRTDNLRMELKLLSIGELSSCMPPRSKAKSKHAMVEELLRPQHTFHGTRSSIVDSIAKFGLLAAGDIDPATGLPIVKALGSTYGQESTLRKNLTWQ